MPVSLPNLTYFRFCGLFVIFQIDLLAVFESIFKFSLLFKRSEISLQGHLRVVTIQISSPGQHHTSFVFFINPFFLFSTVFLNTNVILSSQFFRMCICNDNHFQRRNLIRSYVIPLTNNKRFCQKMSFYP